MLVALTLNYNDAESVVAFVKSIESYSIIDYIVIVDNASTDDSLSVLRPLCSSRVLLIENSENKGYGPGNNVGIRYIVDRFGDCSILLSNPDVLISEAAVESLYSFSSSIHDCAVVSTVMKDRHGEICMGSPYRLPTKWQYIWSIDVIVSKFFRPLMYSSAERPTEGPAQVGAVSGSCFMLNSDLFVKSGMFDENLFLYCEEVSISNRIHAAGYHVYFIPDAFFIHNHSVSINKTFSSELKKRSLLNRSKIHVIMNCYKSSRFDFVFCKLLAAISMVETYVLSLFR